MLDRTWPGWGRASPGQGTPLSIPRDQTRRMAYSHCCNRDQDRDRVQMGCTNPCGSFHITPERGQRLKLIDLHCSNPGPFPVLVSVPLSVNTPPVRIPSPRQDQGRTYPAHRSPLAPPCEQRDRNV